MFKFIKSLFGNLFKSEKIQVETYCKKLHVKHVKSGDIVFYKNDLFDGTYTFSEPKKAIVIKNISNEHILLEDPPVWLKSGEYSTGGIFALNLSQLHKTKQQAWRRYIQDARDHGLSQRYIDELEYYSSL